GRLRPLDASVHYRQGFALFRADDLDGAAAALEQARLAEPDHAESLLLLGTIRQGQNDPEAVTLLRRFVEVAPEHTAAGPIRTWLAEHDGTPES
ncbi:MAG: tetratricopeptide repeat protein, partial [Brachybacterium sp.]|nr:tetratricopeptide repeat protein [Brachybacterium sp.]